MTKLYDLYSKIYNIPNFIQSILVRVGPLTQYWAGPLQIDPGTGSLLKSVI